MTDRTPSAREVLAVTVVLSACSLMYELLIAQTLSLAAANTVIWYSLTVGVYLGAMGLGAVVFDSGRTGGGWSALFTVELLLSIVGAGAVLLIRMQHSLYLYVEADTGGGSLLLFFGTALATIVLVGILSGVELPMLIRLGNDVSADGKLTNRVLGWDYIGALAAGLLFPLALVPYLDVAVIGLGTGAVNLLVGAYILVRFVPREGGFLPRMALALALGGVLVFGISRASSIEQYFLKRHYFTNEAVARNSMFGPLHDMPDVLRAHSPYQNIDLVTDTTNHWGKRLIDAYSTKFLDDPAFPRDLYLFLNRDFQVNSNFEEIYHEWFAHVPIILNGKVPERVLVLGGGDGLLMRELVKHDGIRSVTHVDLDSRLVALADTLPQLVAMNHHSLADPRVRTWFADAFQYVRTSDERFDAIYLDFPFVKDYNLSKLYSREFYHFVRARLAEGGYAVLDAPAQNFDPVPDAEGDLRLARGDETEVYYNTIRSAGFEDIVPYATRLDLDNPGAFEALDGWSGAPPKAGPGPDQELRAALRREWMRQIVQRHVDALEQGFIVMWKESRADRTPVYRDLGVELHVLNRTRFGLSFPPPFPASAPVNEFLVNSILRPTLPRRSVWSVR